MKINHCRVALRSACVSQRHGSRHVQANNLESSSPKTPAREQRLELYIFAFLYIKDVAKDNKLKNIIKQFHRSPPLLLSSLPIIVFVLTNMSFQNHPADPKYGGDRLQLFNIERPLTLSIQDFEAKWKEVDNVWVQFGSTKMLKKDQGWTKS